MKISVPYGETFLEADVQNNLDISVLKPVDIGPLGDQNTLLKKAIQNPIGSSRLSEIVQKGGKICIVVNDITRKTPTKIILKEIIEEININYRIPDKNITILIATGNHRSNTPEEIEKIVGKEYLNRFKVVNHNARSDKDLIFLETTSRGVPIQINRYFVESEVKILTGTIRPHQSAGYSGGRKSVLPGLAGLQTIKKHHSFPIFPLVAQLGKIAGNTFHEESLAAAKKVGVDFIVNVIENPKGEIIDAVAGELNAAHMEGIKKASKIWQATVNEKVDIIVASAGGYPTDINLHQAQKALASCEHVIKKDGVVVLVAKCNEGAGKLPEWFEGLLNPQEAIDKFKKVGWSPDVHAKPFLIARALSNFKVIMVRPCISEKILRKMFFLYENSLEKAINRALNIISCPSPKILFLPYACDVIPVLGSNSN